MSLEPEPVDNAANPGEKALAFARLVHELRFRKMALYQAHPKQLEFHAMGAEKRSRLFMAGNQQGKTLSGSFECAVHLTGLYPPWWRGFRFDRPIKCWVGGLNGSKIRDNPQLKLMGPRSAWGTGMIPRDCLSGEPAMSKGTTGLIDFIEITSAFRGKSTLKFMSYDMQDDAWESDTLHLIWFDEEPPQKKYSAGMARLTVTGGLDYITATPMLGMSQVVRLFYPFPVTPDRGLVRAGIADALHIPETERTRIINRYQFHERKARVEGFPILGSGQVYDTPEEALGCEPFEIPDHYFQLLAMDLGGGDHPTAFVRLAWDKDTDTVYVCDAYKGTDARISTHAAAMKIKVARRDTEKMWIPVAYPKDAFIQDRSCGDTFAEIYRQHGVQMLGVHAQFPDGGTSVEAGVAVLQDRMSSGRFKVFRPLSSWWEEYRLYHREVGLIAKEFDDLMDATRYGAMMLRFARRAPMRRQVLQVVGMDYNPLGGT